MTKAGTSGIERRFWAKVKKSDGCWEWTAAIGRGGYGSVASREAGNKAHRLSWIIHNGEIPAGLCVLHRCDNRICVNPAHLFLGTKAENNADRDAKGRHRALSGARNGFAKLSDEKVRELRRLYALGMPQKQIARKLGVHHTTVNLAAARKTWAHVR